MCMDIRKTCHCGKHSVQLHLRDNIMAKEVVVGLYCPECGADVQLDYQTMLYDNGWVIVYDMDLAKFLAVANLRMEPENVQPGFLFDEGYATWQELYPGEQRDIAAERNDIIKLMAEDQQRYLTEIHRWNIERVARLKAEGWRKVQRA